MRGAWAPHPAPGRLLPTLPLGSRPAGFYGPDSEPRGPRRIAGTAFLPPRLADREAGGAHRPRMLALTPAGGRALLSRTPAFSG